MANPTQKHTKSSKRKRAKNFALKKVKLSKCPKCGRPVLPYHVCKFCGTYAGREVLKIKIKKGKKEKGKEKEEKVSQQKKKLNKKTKSLQELPAK